MWTPEIIEVTQTLEGVAFPSRTFEAVIHKGHKGKYLQFQIQCLISWPSLLSFLPMRGLQLTAKGQNWLSIKVSVLWGSLLRAKYQFCSYCLTNLMSQLASPDASLSTLGGRHKQFNVMNCISYQIILCWPQLACYLFLNKILLEHSHIHLLFGFQSSIVKPTYYNFLGWKNNLLFGQYRKF